MVRREAVFHTPQDSLGPTADVDLAVDGADVGLDGVRAEVGECGDLGVAPALGDQGEDFCFAVGEAFSATSTMPSAACRPMRTIGWIVVPSGA